MYCPKINYCFNEDDIRTLNERIKSIANNYNDDQTGWFEVDEKQHLVFVDEQDNMFVIHLRGRFFRSDDPEFDLDYVTLEKDGISFSFDINIFDDHV
jgi:hypothetical protein